MYNLPFKVCGSKLHRSFEPPPDSIVHASVVWFHLKISKRAVVMTSYHALTCIVGHDHHHCT